MYKALVHVIALERQCQNLLYFKLSHDTFFICMEAACEKASGKGFLDICLSFFKARPKLSNRLWGLVLACGLFQFETLHAAFRISLIAHVMESFPMTALCVC